MVRGVGRWWWLGVLACAGACGDDDAGVMDAGGECVSSAECDDGTFCNGAESCDPGDPTADARGCVAGAPPCGAGTACIEASSSCGPLCSDPDADGDGAVAAECGGDDCDDTDPLRAPALPEVCDLEGRDEDCDPSTVGERDDDGDGVVDARCCNGDRCGLDCDDARAGTHPSVPEVCDGFDNDCDGAVDEGLLERFFVDADRDLYGDPDRPVDACPGDPGVSASPLDCDDADPTVNEPQGEIRDGVDNDCDGSVDEEVVVSVWYVDMDGDGYGDPEGARVEADAPPEGFGLLPIDCDDGDADIRPGAPERCNGLDDDCNGQVDFRVGINDTEDDDADGAADAACGGTDCDDRDRTRRPGALEVCNGVDDDCDMDADESCGTMDGGIPDAGPMDAGCDSDGDGALAMRCGGTDCDDTNPDIRPFATEVCDPFHVDEDCDPSTTGRDVDSDGAEDATCCNGARCGDDCDDLDENVRPFGAEACNGRDDDCDGRVDEGIACSAPTHVELGQEMSCVIDNNGDPHCWGHNFNGSLGVGAGGGFFATPRRINGTVDMRDISVAGRSGASCGAEETTGEVYCWGRNLSGSLGVGDESMRTVPTTTGLLGARSVGTAGSMACALTEDGAVYCWGNNGSGQLAFRGANRSTPTRVLTFGRWDQLTVSGSGGCVRRAGEVWCWGPGDPERVPGRWSGMTSGEGRCLIDEMRRLHCSSSPGAPFRLESGAPTGIRWAARAGGTTCVLAGTTLSCEGSDAEGQLGDGAGVTSAGIWVEPTGGRAWVAASVGDRHVCAVDSTGAVFCWGRDVEGQLGDGTEGSPDAEFAPVGVSL